MIFFFKSSFSISIHFRTYRQENLENIIQVKFYKEGRNPNLKSHYLIRYFYSYLKIVGTNVPKYLNWKLSNFLKFLFFFFFFLWKRVLFFNRSRAFTPLPHPATMKIYFLVLFVCLHNFFQIPCYFLVNLNHSFSIIYRLNNCQLLLLKNTLKNQQQKQF